MVSASRKSCASDPFLSSILSLCLDELLRVITKMVNLSSESGQFAEVWKNAYALVLSLTKKSGLQEMSSCQHFTAYIVTDWKGSRHSDS